LAGVAGCFSPFKEALHDVAGEDISGNARRIGKLLSARKGQIAHGLFLTSRKPNEKDAVCYRVAYEGERQEWRE
jgi:protein-arginine kinase activator protein McsA